MSKLTPREQDELVPMFSYWQREDGAVDMVTGRAGYHEGALYVDFTTFWPGDPRRGFGTKHAQRFAASRRRLVSAPAWTAG